MVHVVHQWFPMSSLQGKVQMYHHQIFPTLCASALGPSPLQVDLCICSLVLSAVCCIRRGLRHGHYCGCYSGRPKQLSSWLQPVDNIATFTRREYCDDKLECDRCIFVDFLYLAGKILVYILYKHSSLNCASGGSTASWADWRTWSSRCSW